MVKSAFQSLNLFPNVLSHTKRVRIFLDYFCEVQRMILFRDKGTGLKVLAKVNLVYK